MKGFSISSFFAVIFTFADRLGSFFKPKSKKNQPYCFKRIFYRAEGKELMGKRTRDFWFILLFFFLTILAIGFANDSLRYLEHQMSSPFVMHITAPWDYGKDRLNDAYYNYKENPALAEQYGYTSIYEYAIWSENIEGVDRTARVRSVVPDDTLTHIILEGEINPVEYGYDIEQYKGYVLTEQSYGVIVTADFLFGAVGQSLEDPPFIELNRGRGKLPIVAIVEDLPDNSDMVATPFFYEYVRPDERGFFGLRDDSSSLTFIVDIDPSSLPGVMTAFDEVKSALNQMEDIPEIIHRSIERFDDMSDYPVAAYRPAVLVHFNMDGFLDPNERAELFNLIAEKEVVVEFLNDYDKDRSALLEFYHPRRNTPMQRNEEIRAIGITFDDLAHVRSFRDNFEIDTGIPLDMGRIHQLENYHFVTMLTIVVAAVLTIFSLLSIAIYVGNMIGKHLYKIQKNIGTYKAFGIEIRGVYKLMVFVMLFVSLLIASVICFVIAEAGLIALLVGWRVSIAEGYKFFYIFDWVPMLAIVFILAVSYIWSNYIINQMFNKSPGDLVYERDKSA